MSDFPENDAIEFQTLYLALLYKGPRWTGGDTPEARDREERHYNYLLKLQQEGKILAFGPIVNPPRPLPSIFPTPNKDLFGMAIFRTDRDEALALIRVAPHIVAMHQRFELHTWLVAQDQQEQQDGQDASEG